MSEWNCLKQGSNVRRELWKHQRLCGRSQEEMIRLKDNRESSCQELGTVFAGGLMVQFREFKNRGLLLHTSVGWWKERSAFSKSRNEPEARVWRR